MISFQEFFEGLEPEQVDKFQNAFKDLNEVIETLNGAQKEFFDEMLREAVIRDDNDGKIQVQTLRDPISAILNRFSRHKAESIDNCPAKYYSVGSINAQLGRLAKIK